MSEKAGAKATPLNADEAAQWRRAQSEIDALARGLVAGEALNLEARRESIRSIPLDMKRVLNAVHVPEDAGEYAVGLERILRRIPEGWGRWVSCGPGWYPLLIELDEKLAALDANYSLHQVKEKYGRLRYYYSTRAKSSSAKGRAMDKAVETAEVKAAYTCELCGQDGQLMASGGNRMGWYQTLCTLDAEKSGYAPVLAEEEAVELN